MNARAPIASAESSPSPAPQRNPAMLFRFVGMPPNEYAAGVSQSEPHWVALAERDLSAAREELAGHLTRLEALAPWAASARDHVGQLPSFDLGGDDKRLREKLDRFVKARGYDVGLAAELAAAAPRSLALAAKQLEKIRFGQARELEKGKRLQRLLEEVTGCKAIPLLADESLGARDIERANEQLGALWAWYLNEVAYTERAWHAYRTLRGR